MQLIVLAILSFSIAVLCTIRLTVRWIDQDYHFVVGYFLLGVTGFYCFMDALLKYMVSVGAN